MPAARLYLKALVVACGIAHTPVEADELPLVEVMIPPFGPCIEAEKLISRLEVFQRETPVAAADALNGQIELFWSKRTGDWTLVGFLPVLRRACVLDLGKIRPRPKLEWPA